MEMEMHRLSANAKGGNYLEIPWVLYISIYLTYVPTLLIHSAKIR